MTPKQLAIFCAGISSVMACCMATFLKALNIPHAEGISMLPLAPA
ncbi:hypothetical protein PCH70_16200 [Pseudomonas cichorii JBC1]|nr:hypothetical protein PCH70_16200 [Pseudomonas cichorii JBC1]